MPKYQLEALLRPPVEWLAAAAGAVGAALAWLAPGALMMTPDVARGIALVLALKALWWFGRYRSIAGYHRALRRMPYYGLSPDEIPVSANYLFLGRGFRWDPRHTQRLYDTFSKKGHPYIRPSSAYDRARSLQLRWERKPGETIPLLTPRRFTAALSAALARDAWWNPWPPASELGGEPAIHGVGLRERERDQMMPRSERVGHTLVLGTTRVGKTVAMGFFATQDIRVGDTVIVFDPKGDGELLRRIHAEAHRAGRGDQLYIFHLGFPELSARYSPIGHFSRITEIASRTKNQLPKEGNSAPFAEFTWRYVNNIASAVVALGERPTYEVLKRYAIEIELLLVRYLRHLFTGHPHLTNWEAEVAEIKAALGEKRNAPPPERLDALAMAELYNRYLSTHESPTMDDIALSLIATTRDTKFYAKLTASLLPLLDKLTTGKIAELINPVYGDDDPRPILDWRTILRTGGIVYVGLDALTDPEVAAAVGNAMFADLTAAAGEIYKHGLYSGLPTTDRPRKLALHADEVNELMGPEFIPMCNKAGGAGFQITAYTQTWSDIEARLKDKALAGQVGGNFNTLMMLRVKELATAELLTDQLGMVEVDTEETRSNASDGDLASGKHFGSGVMRAVRAVDKALIDPAWLIKLPKGQAFVYTQGHLHKVRLPRILDHDDPHLPREIDEMVEAMKRRASGGDNAAWNHWVSAQRSPLQ